MLFSSFLAHLPAKRATGSHLGRALVRATAQATLARLIDKAEVFLIMDIIEKLYQYKKGPSDLAGATAQASTARHPTQNFQLLITQHQSGSSAQRRVQSHQRGSYLRR